MVVVRDEEWLVTSAEQGADGWLVHVRGLVRAGGRDHRGVLLQPRRDRGARPRSSEGGRRRHPRGYRNSRLWLEALSARRRSRSAIRRSRSRPRCSPTPLRYQQSAVRKALDPANIRPRILLADAVGLGKTLEIGMILAELVRRGRGERILIVTPRHVLEQMQHELWTRFALPFVRLDSAGIQRVRQKLPATRNPFTYYKRAIISIDTLKSRPLPRAPAKAALGRGGHRRVAQPHQRRHPEQPARPASWPRTPRPDPASATPHNGKAESFAELIRLLDPTRGARRTARFTEDEVERLVIRRHRHSPEVAAEVGADWAERAEPVQHAGHAVRRRGRGRRASCRRPGCTPRAAARRTPGDTKALFPWTLAKAFLSSPAALRRVDQASAAPSSTRPTPTQRTELEALDRARRAQRGRAAASRPASTPRWSSTSSDIGVGQGIADAGGGVRRAGRHADAGCASTCRRTSACRPRTSRSCTAASPTTSSRRSSTASSRRRRRSGCWSPATSPPRA